MTSDGQNSSSKTESQLGLLLEATLLLPPFLLQPFLTFSPSSNGTMSWSSMSSRQHYPFVMHVGVGSPIGLLPLPMESLQSSPLELGLGPHMAGSLQTNKAKADIFGPAVASGRICGDRIWTLPSSVLALAGADLGKPKSEYLATYDPVYRTASCFATCSLLEPLSSLGQRCIGKVVCKKINKAKADAFESKVASSLNCGDGIWTLRNSKLALAGVKQPISTKFLSSGTHVKVGSFLGS
ncbi:hypothetical protein HHK36_014588 [Tetracentron sinense]|uniref:Uncharacterized protein n=1 Tax=Tetracentron sinense TaxID=13715 RepID=A0A834Z3N7_TETSI|nr:hypothetical protein HHK36_014588 [Tetracentron sinense]